MRCIVKTFRRPPTGRIRDRPVGGTTGPGRGVAGREEDSDPWVLGIGFGFLF